MTIPILVPDVVNDVVIRFGNPIEMPLDLSSGALFRLITDLRPKRYWVLSTQYGSVRSKRLLGNDIPVVVAFYVVGQISVFGCLVRCHNPLLDASFVGWIYVPC